MFNLPINQKWTFPSNNYGQVIGINDSGIETFAGTRIKSLAREICQNSVDARLDYKLPTRVEFSTFEIDPHTIPDFATLEDALKRSLDFWGSLKAQKAKEFFEKALQMISAKSLVCLRISDYNTFGLRGSHAECQTPWCDLTKSAGASDKSGGGGGSFGIGKFAPFACSTLRTVFYSTYADDDVSASQGVARLTSFRNKNNEITQGIGFYGNEKNSPMYAQYSLDPDYVRKDGETGTDIFILGFTEEAGWKDKLVASILDSFLYAVYSCALTVDVDGITIDKDSLPCLMESYKSYLKEHADEYYQTLVNDKLAKTFTREYSDEPETAGTLTLRLMIMPGFCRHVAMIRKNGMKIMDKDRISSLIPFAGTLLIEGEAINSYLLNLENPQHLRWEMDRAKNRAQLERLNRFFMKFIKASLNEMRDDDTEDSLDPSVGEYLSANDSEEASNEEHAEGINDAIKAINVHTTKVMPKPSDTATEEYTGQTLVEAEDGDIFVTDLPGDGGSGSDGNGGHGGQGGGKNPGNGSGDEPTEHKKKLSSIPPANVRNMIRNKEAGEYTIVFTPLISAESGILEVFMSAESQNYEALIKNATCKECPNLKFSQNQIKELVFTAGKPLRIDIQLDYYDYCSMEVKAYGNQV